MLNAPPTKRCQYCNLKFYQCLFFQYAVITLALVSVLLAITYWLDGEITKSVTIVVFVLIIVYGYFFSRSTGKIVEANFSERKAKEALQELADHLENKVKAQTRNLEEKNNNLVKLLAMRSEFLDLASHQLRTPVGVIKNIMEMMDDGDLERLPPEVKKGYVHNAFEKSLKLKKIISDILVTSELDTASFTVNSKNAEDLHLEDLVDKNVAETKFEAGQKNIAIDWQRPEKPLPLVAGYEHYLSYAISNLIDNAVKYTPSTGETSETRNRRDEPGWIKIRTEAKGREVIVSVEDNGIGIPPDEIGNMFKKFSRATNARKMYTDGSGLGLYIIKEIIEGHGGRVSVQSKLEEGSTFKIFLPIKK
jgi:signal transduction histidine kinase